ncbi:MAG: class I SAM-dependent methyltransferase [Candidatus Marinimicrobia bacterium]|nr:class I SAM-dependent methyltransferase [Candidatus Neomarinimicrobiota bacterium]MBL7030375.1 class I SAM-dependent methyltransferase [Candidatus Neomarinimicrobiota bacterium]
MKGYSENYWAKRAGQYNKTNWVKNEDFIDSFLNMLPRNNFETILEVGIGTGAVANKVSERIGPLTGIDISKEMIAKIKHPDITPIVANAHDLPFEDASFELIYMRNVIHYIDDPVLAFSEIYRCLKPNGCFLFSQVVPPEDSISEEYDWLIGRNIHYPTQGEIVQLFSKYLSVDSGHFILKNQSIMNWLNNTCRDESQKQEAIDRHKNTSDSYQKLANFIENDNDILVDIKHFMVFGQKI